MPQANIMMDAFGLIVMLIVFFSCLEERIRKESLSNNFLMLMGAIIITLVADIFGWIGEGVPSLSLMTIIGTTVASCSGYLAIFFFMAYLRENLFKNSRGMQAIVIIFGILCAISLIYQTASAFNGYGYVINSEGHYVRSDEMGIMLTNLAFPVFSFLVSTMMIFIAPDVTIQYRMFYLLYAVFPTVGAIFDYLVHGWSLTYIGLVIGTVMIYTNIYLQKRKLIQEQRNALMMSQINPHFMYNTLTTIASMCELEPKEAKGLTIEFSQFLRQNLDTMSSTELIPFEQELRHVGCYLKIERARFKERVNVVYDIKAKSFLIPPLSIQPLVENAVKHGITKKRDGGTVRITTYQTEKSYVVEIKDDGVGFDVERLSDNGRSSIGINNVKSRLKEMCGGKLEIKSMVGVGTRATVTLPRKKTDRDDMKI